MSRASLSVIGAGRAGGTLARLWQASGHFQIAQLFGRRAPIALANELQAQACDDLQQLAPGEAALIATPDAAIAEVATALADRAPDRWAHRVVFHLSGVHDSTLLAPLQVRGAHIASAHPVRSFSGAKASFEGTLVGVEGDPAARATVEAAFAAIGGECFAIDPAHKALYHTAAVAASNHLVALADWSQQLWQRAGLDEHTAARLFHTLAGGTLNNLAQQAPVDALTGPVARGDADTVTAHLRALQAADADPRQLYAPLSRQLMSLIAARLEPEAQQALHRALDHGLPKDSK